MTTDWKNELHLLYIIGAPGVGKSTLMAELVKGRRRQVRMKPFANTYYYEDGLVQLGRERGNGFSGTDSLSMSVQPKVVEVLVSGAWPKIVGEGDRLTNGRFFTTVKEETDYHLDVVLLEAPEDVLEARRTQRGSAQNETWLKGRMSKIRGLEPFVTRRLDARLPIEKLAMQLAWHPVLNSE